MKQWKGLATAGATRRRCEALLPAEAWSLQGPWTVSRLGWGTLPGELKNIVDSKIERALSQVLAGGVNVLDTSPAYRCRRSQAAVGVALGRELARGTLAREEIVVGTHAGWIHTARMEDDPADVLKDEVLPATGLTATEFAGGVWSLHPAWLRHQLDLASSLAGLESFDLLWLDAPETALRAWPRERWRSHLLEAFRTCEEWVAQGRLGGYGLTSLEGFPADGQGRPTLNLEELWQLARQAAGGDPAWRGLMLPYSLASLDLLNLNVGERPLATWAKEHNLWLQTILPLGQGQLAQGLPGFLRQAMPELSAAQCALQVVRSTAGVGTVVVGMKSREHITENLALLAHPALSQGDWLRLFDSGN
jgi:aryl-alcohol dehydrogenase-like predicted oxidoreductase